MTWIASPPTGWARAPDERGPGPPASRSDRTADGDAGCHGAGPVIDLVPDAVLDLRDEVVPAARTWPRRAPWTPTPHRRPWPRRPRGEPWPAGCGDADG